MRKLSLPAILPAILLALLVVSPAACGGPSSGSSTVDSDPTGDATTATSNGSSAARIAPDFTLQLGNGGRFTLSEEQRPVFLVFWAEW